MPILSAILMVPGIKTTTASGLTILDACSQFYRLKSASLTSTSFAIR
jgi:hypothetical protein